MYSGVDHLYNIVSSQVFPQEFFSLLRDYIFSKTGYRRKILNDFYLQMSNKASSGSGSGWKTYQSLIGNNKGQVNHILFLM